MTTSQTIVQARRALFVTWQDPRTKQYYPVGRLLEHPADDKPRFEFAYLRGLAKARHAGFSGFVAFPDTEQVYYSDELFPLFANRLMPRSRPDFGEYVNRLDLDPSVDDLTILGRSGGRRATDSLEVFPLPDLAEHGCYVTYFLAHGIRYLPTIATQRIERLQEGERLRLQWDMDNEADPVALSLRTEDRIVIGYVPRYLLEHAWMLLQTCDYRPKITVAQVNVPPAPTQQRLLCRMESCWPEGFVPYSGEDYQPLLDTASRLASSWPENEGI